MFKLKAPAKVNLYLHVLKKRPDGFHEIETLFERIDLTDELTFRRDSGGIRLQVSGANTGSLKQNLVYRAARLVKNRFHIKEGVSIHLKKRIPVAAGLAGGSSDAAATLMGLNRVWRLRLTERKLLNLAAELGSDVPFFILDTSYAVGKGRGEKLKKLNLRKKHWHVLVKTPFRTLAKEVYQALKPADLTPHRADARMLRNLKKNRNSIAFNPLLFNSLERVLLKKYPRLRTIKDDLMHAGSGAVLVSGSGPTIFGMTRSRKDAIRIARKMKKLYRSSLVRVVRTY